MDERVYVSKKSVFIGRWNYSKPTLQPNEDGDIILVFQASMGPCEWWQWSIDIQGRFWMEYRWCENDFYEDSCFKKEQTREEMIERIRYMQRFFSDYGLQEYVEVYQGVEEFLKKR